MRYHVKFHNHLSPPNLFDTREQAHEFFVLNRDDGERTYTLEAVREATLGDLLTLADITSAIRENAQQLFGNESLADSETYAQHKASLGEAVHAAMDIWGVTHNMEPDGIVVLSATVVTMPEPAP